MREVSRAAVARGRPRSLWQLSLSGATGSGDYCAASNEEWLLPLPATHRELRQSVASKEVALGELRMHLADVESRHAGGSQVCGCH